VTDVALFRYGLIRRSDPHGTGRSGDVRPLKDKASHSYAIPGTRRTRVAAETMARWLREWRKGGFEALRPQPRADQGQHVRSRRR